MKRLRYALLSAVAWMTAESFATDAPMVESVRLLCPDVVELPKDDVRLWDLSTASIARHVEAEIMLIDDSLCFVTRDGVKSRYIIDGESMNLFAIETRLYGAVEATPMPWLLPSPKPHSTVDRSLGSNAHMLFADESIRATDNDDTMTKGVWRYQSASGPAIVITPGDTIRNTRKITTLSTKYLHLDSLSSIPITYASQRWYGEKWGYPLVEHVSYGIGGETISRETYICPPEFQPKEEMICKMSTRPSDNPTYKGGIIKRASEDATEEILANRFVVGDLPSVNIDGGKLTVSVGEGLSGDKSMLLCDVAGRIYATSTPDASDIAVFDISGLHQGYYILAIGDGETNEAIYKFRIE